MQRGSFCSFNFKEGGEGEITSSPPLFKLSLVYFHNQQEIYSQLLHGDEEIRLWYIHSSDHTPVEQVFAISKEGHLTLLEERYSWYGAGLEFGSGLDFEFMGEQVIVSGYDRTLESLLLRVARTVPQKLFIDTKELILTDMIEGGARILIEILKIDEGVSP